jgi:cytochrome P450
MEIIIDLETLKSSFPHLADNPDQLDALVAETRGIYENAAKLAAQRQQIVIPSEPFLSSENKTIEDKDEVSVKSKNRKLGKQEHTEAILEILQDEG